MTSTSGRTSGLRFSWIAPLSEPSQSGHCTNNRLSWTHAVPPALNMSERSDAEKATRCLAGSSACESSSRSASSVPRSSSAWAAATKVQSRQASLPHLGAKTNGPCGIEVFEAIGVCQRERVEYGSNPLISEHWRRCWTGEETGTSSRVRWHAAVPVVSLWITGWIVYLALRLASSRRAPKISCPSRCELALGATVLRPRNIDAAKCCDG